MHSSSVVVLPFFLLLLIVYDSHQASTEFREPSLKGRGLALFNQLNAEEQNAVVTLLFTQQIEPSAEELLSSAIVSAMISRSQNSKSRNGSEYDVIIVERINQEMPTDNPHQISLFLKDGGRPVSSITTAEVISEYRQFISDRSGLHLANVSRTTPNRKSRVPRAEPDTSAAPPTAQSTGAASEKEGEEKEKHDSSSSSSVWVQHRWLFIAIIVFICVSLVLTIICCICLRCCKSTPAKQPEEIKEEKKVIFSPSGPMKEHSPPNEPPPIDEENGWIIPLDQMTKEELEQPEVQVSRL